MLLLTGATGKTGGAAAGALLEMGVPFRALVRDADKATALRESGVAVIVGDAGDAGAVKEALAGCERAALILPNSQAQEAMELQFVDLAKQAGVRHIVKLSSHEALAEATCPIPALHYKVEQYIRSSGLDWTMIRPNFFMQNLLAAGRTIKSEGKFYFPFGDGETVMMDCRDIGLVFATVLAEDGHAGQSYELTGPEKLTFHDVARQFSAVLGKPVEYVDQDPAVYRDRVGPFLSSEWHLNSVMQLFREIAAGTVPVEVTDTFKRLTGRDPIPFRQFVEDHRPVFE
jgi:uncharacterized protein YbjT (DUF2867 family)